MKMPNNMDDFGANKMVGCEMTMEVEGEDDNLDAESWTLMTVQVVWQFVMEVPSEESKYLVDRTITLVSEPLQVMVPVAYYNLVYVDPCDSTNIGLEMVDDIVFDEFDEDQL